MSLFSRAEKAAGDGFTWETFHPSPHHPWTVVTKDEAGERAFLAYDPGRDAFRKAVPEDDQKLSELRAWMARGTLLAYRVGVKATVEARLDTDLVYAKVLTSWKFVELQRKLQAAGDARGTANDGFPALISAVDAYPGVILFGQLPGHSLKNVLLYDPIAVSGALHIVARSLARFHEVSAPGVLAGSTDCQANLAYRVSLVADYFPEHAKAYERAYRRLCEIPDRLDGATGHLVHKDLHDGNIFVAGQDSGILDLECLGAGDPSDDIGNLAAHIMLRALQRGSDPHTGKQQIGEFLDAYRDAGGQVQPLKFATSVASTLYRLACIYLFRRRWQRLAPNILLLVDDWTNLARGRHLNSGAL